MIKRFKIKNFKCLREVDIPLNNFNVFIGPNNTGKTSLLEALRLFSKTSLFPVEKWFTEPGTFEKIKWCGAKEPEIYLGLGYQNLEYDMIIGTSGGKTVIQDEILRSSGAELLNRKNAQNPGRTFKKFGDQGGSRVQREVEYKGQTIILMDQESACSSYQHPSGTDELTQIRTLLTNIKSYTLRPSQLARNSYLEPDKLQNPQMDMFGYGLPSILSILASTAPEDIRYQEIKKYLREAIPEIANFGITPVPVYPQDRNSCLWDMSEQRDTSGEKRPHIEVTGQSLYFELKGHKGHRAPASLMSDGVLLVLGYLTLAYTTQHPAILLIEEPENGIHPKLLKFVVEVLRGMSRGLDQDTPPVQIILTTHSPYLLDAVAPEEVYIFQKDEQGASQITPMSQVKGIQDWLSEYMLGELWYNWGEEELVRRAKL